MFDRQKCFYCKTENAVLSFIDGWKKQRWVCRACYKKKRMRKYQKLRKSLWKLNKAGIKSNEEYFAGLKKLDDEYLRDPKLKR